MTNLLLKNIEKKYANLTVLQFDELKINTGIFWLKGGNGTGKTTFFRIISGQTPFEGTVLLNGIDLKQKPVKFRAKISYAEADPQYPLFITGNELINFYKDIRKATDQEISFLTHLFEMDTFLNQKIGDYSSGMLKKLSLICAFIGEVELYILDEPLITIDQPAAAKLYRLIDEKAKLGKTFLLSSHQEIDKEHLNISGIFAIKDKQIVRC